MFRGTTRLSAISGAGRLCWGSVAADPARQVHRVDGRAVLPHLEVDVAAGDVARLPGPADDVALGDPLAGPHVEAAEVVGDRDVAAAVDPAVVDDHLVAVGGVAGRGDGRLDGAARGGVLRVPAGRADVDAGVEPLVAGQWVHAHAVGRGDVQRVGHGRGHRAGAAATAAAARSPAARSPTAARPAAGAAAAGAPPVRGRPALALLALAALLLAPLLLTALGLAGRDGVGAVRLDLGDDVRQALLVGPLLGEVLVELLAQPLQLGGERRLLLLDGDDLPAVLVGRGPGGVGSGHRLLRLRVELVDTVPHRLLAQLAVAVDGRDRLELGDDLRLRPHGGVDDRRLPDELLAGRGVDDHGEAVERGATTVGAAGQLTDGGAGRLDLGVALGELLPQALQLALGDDEAVGHGLLLPLGGGEVLLGLGQRLLGHGQAGVGVLQGEVGLGEVGVRALQLRLQLLAVPGVALALLPLLAQLAVVLADLVVVVGGSAAPAGHQHAREERGHHGPDEAAGTTVRRRHVTPSCSGSGRPAS